ncbi:MAG: deoxyribose-phosphate aldolase [Betaproteobacteria bacterium]|nr:deoxyribose-phosphate aldolase [Betaproteobacteria bacterium]
MQTTHPSLEKDFSAQQQLLSNPSDRVALAALIDHTLLKMDAQESHLSLLLEEAYQNRFRAICVSGSALEFLQPKISALQAQGSGLQLCTVIGFPHGNNCTAGKVSEVAAALEQGAGEFDYVQNVSWVKDGHWGRLTGEAEKIVRAAQGKLVKVILETSLLSEEEIFHSAQAAAQGGVHVLKTSTGFGARGASQADMEILSHVQAEHEKKHGLRLGIKASGGIRSLTDALTMIQLGATRLGTSAGVILVNGLNAPHTGSY